MHVDDPPLAQSLGPCRRNIILPYYLQHIGTHITGKSGQSPKGGNQDGKQEVPGQIPKFTEGTQIRVPHGVDPGNGKPVQMNPKQHHTQQGQPEGRNGKPDKDKQRRSMIKQGTLVGSGINTNGEGNKNNEDQGEDVDGNRDGDSFLDFFDDGTVIRGKGVSKIEQNHPFQPESVLHDKRLIESIIGHQPLANLRGHFGIQVGCQTRRLSWRQVNHHK